MAESVTDADPAATSASLSIYVITGLARTTIDRILESKLSATHGDVAEYLGRFYRPDRWNEEALRDEHRFLLDCEEAELPVVAPLPDSEGETLQILALPAEAAGEEHEQHHEEPGEAAEMARLEGGEFELDLKPHPIGAIITAALDQTKSLLGSRPVEVHIPENLPPVRVDLGRAGGDAVTSPRPHQVAQLALPGAQHVPGHRRESRRGLARKPTATSRRR